jgi:tRNA-dihydrouridine synthase
MARRFEDAGADALTFHPRVAPDRRSRPPKWDYIARVKESVKVPVFGNGDVFSREDCLKMWRDTGCDGIAVGRMAVARPWLFAEWTDGLKIVPDQYLDVANTLITLLSKHYDPVRALRRYKRFSMYFSANFKFGHTLYTRISNAKKIEEIRPILNQFFRQNPEQVSRPNMNLFQ